MGGGVGRWRKSGRIIRVSEGRNVLFAGSSGCRDELVCVCVQGKGYRQRCGGDTKGRRWERTLLVARGMDEYKVGRAGQGG